jgi:para-aminobenzoate synthetase/4-amino-4-deoxychorismate lyase
MGVGSGIVADSNPREEYRECLLKARFLTHRRPALGLIETFRWEEALGFGHLDAHLARMDRSARFFGIPFCPAAAAARLEERVPSFGSGPLLVRLLLSRDGAHDVSTRPLEPPRDLPVPVALSPCTVDSGAPYLSHKTTRREAYDTELRRARTAGLFEILFTNERGELTEGSFTNLFVKRRGVLLTPPLSSGVLPGILRQRLLDAGDTSVVEQVLFPSDLESADGILVGNDVRGLMAAVICRDPKGHSLGGCEPIE